MPRCVTPSSLFLRLISLAAALHRALHDNGVASRARPSNQLDKEAMSLKSADRSERKIRAYAVSLFDHTCPRVYRRTMTFRSVVKLLLRITVRVYYENIVTNIVV